MTNVVCKSRWFTVLEDESGDEFVASSGDEVLIVPVTAVGTVLLIAEPSPAFGGRVLILPGGQAEEGVPLDEMADRELREEIGYRAGEMQPLGEVRPWSKYLAVRSHLFLARDLVEDPLPGDEAHSIIIVEAPLDEIESLVESGRLTDARAIVALYRARGALASTSAAN